MRLILQASSLFLGNLITLFHSDIFTFGNRCQEHGGAGMFQLNGLSCPSSDDPGEHGADSWMSLE